MSAEATHTHTHAARTDTNKQTNKQTNKHTHKDKQTNKQTNTNTRTKTNKQTNKQTQTHTNTNTNTNTHTHTAIYLMESKSPLGRENSHSFPASVINPGLHALQLVAGMGPRAAKSGKFMPAGLVATLGLLSSVYQVRVSSPPSPSSPSRLWRRSYTTRTMHASTVPVYFANIHDASDWDFPPHCLPLVFMAESDMDVYK